MIIWSNPFLDYKCRHFFDTLDTSLIRFHKAHLTNTQMFLDRLRNASPNNAYVMGSFNVIAFYTNVSNESANASHMRASNGAQTNYEHVWLLHSAGHGSLGRVPKLLILLMVWELFCADQRAGNGSTASSDSCYRFYV
ncbi:hypothetical protein KIN20_005933 [Parelaphostrongylus tenuis]|uniref:Uncharacterized protein n=1 Tax=Parelaphostrongylus tenuis TaxID=148309 RepID=A0AAD5QHW3_PARTN|nr:hypothetical protein KIN20_005933 [Parelaphostrongylus tenuis]